jgi:hypothetical protein
MIEVKESNETERFQMAAENAIERLPLHMEDALRLMDKVVKHFGPTEQVLTVLYHTQQSFKLVRELSIKYGFLKEPIREQIKEVLQLNEVA